MTNFRNKLTDTILTARKYLHNPTPLLKIIFNTKPTKPLYYKLAITTLY